MLLLRIAVVIAIASLASIVAIEESPQQQQQQHQQQKKQQQKKQQQQSPEQLERQKQDLVTAIPGQPPVTFQQYAGYVAIDDAAGRALFYWLVEAADDPSSKPLVLWLNGGPGCSSIGYGAMQEIGPFRLNATSVSLNPHSWNRVANILFLESPAGVGFSYSNSTADLQFPGDEKTASDAFVFLQRWIRRFPQYRKRDFYIAGESYAGHYVPQLARSLYYKDVERKLNFKGFMVGNALIDHDSDRLGRVDYWWTHALISRHTYKSILRYCNLGGHVNGTREQCLVIARIAGNELGSVDPYNIYAPVCLSNANDTGGSRRMRAFLDDPVSMRTSFYGYDPCGDDYVQAYMNRPDVQAALHANLTGISYPWTGCSEMINGNWQDSEDTMLPIYELLMKAGLRIWVYSGDVDSVVPVTASRYSIEKLNLAISTPWYPWYRSKQVGGYTEVYNGLTLVTIRGAGHEVPMFQPGRAFTLITSFLDGSLMPPET